MPVHAVYKYATIGLAVTITIMALGLVPNPAFMAPYFGDPATTASSDGQYHETDVDDLTTVTLPVGYLNSIIAMNETERLLMFTPVPSIEKERIDGLSAACDAMFVEGADVSMAESRAYWQCREDVEYQRSELIRRNLHMMLLAGDNIIRGSPYDYTDYQIDYMNQLYRDCLWRETHFQFYLTDDSVATCMDELWSFITEG